MKYFKVSKGFITFKGYDLYSIKISNSYQELVLEHALNKLNNDLKSYAHKFTKLVNFKIITNEPNFLEFKVVSFNKKLDRDFESKIGLLKFDNFNPIIML